MLWLWRTARLCAPICTLMFGPTAIAQIAPAAPGQAPAIPSYTPTSLKPEVGLPRTPDGRPDFQDAVWTTDFFSMLEASPMGPSLVVSEAQARAISDTLVKTFTAPFYAKLFDAETLDLMRGSRGLPIVRGERRSRLIVLPADGKLPLTPRRAGS
jgi:hypothetical protein